MAERNGAAAGHPNVIGALALAISPFAFPCDAFLGAPDEVQSYMQVRGKGPSSDFRRFGQYNETRSPWSGSQGIEGGHLSGD